MSRKIQNVNVNTHVLGALVIQEKDRSLRATEGPCKDGLGGGASGGVEKTASAYGARMDLLI